MNYTLIKDVLDLVAEFEIHNKDSKFHNDIKGFKSWIKSEENSGKKLIKEPDWEGKSNGRSPESFINTSLVHMNRYAKTYSKSAIYNSEFSTQEDFIYLIVLQSLGEMSKMELIKKNIHEKPTGIKIIDRLLDKKWIEQKVSKKDKRIRMVNITELGKNALKNQMDKIRQATKIVTGNLSWDEKMELIRLLQKLDDFHQPIYHENIDSESLLEMVYTNYLTTNN